jgi:hypothetical protein
LKIDISSTTPFYPFTTGITRKFVEGASFPYFEYLITSFRLVSWVSEGPLCSYFQYNSVLLVYDWYYAQVCWRGLAPLFPVTYYLFSTCTLCYWRGLAPMTRSLLVYD